MKNKLIISMDKTTIIYKIDFSILLCKNYFC